MNIRKINEEVLKMSFKKNSRILIGEEENKVYVSPDGYVVFILESSEFKLDIEKILDGRSTTNIIKRFVETEYQMISTVASLVNYKDMFVLSIKKTLHLARFENEETHASVDSKYLKYFNKDATFFISSPIKPVYVYENDVCVGFILPVRTEV